MVLCLKVESGKLEVGRKDERLKLSTNHSITQSQFILVKSLNQEIILATIALCRFSACSVELRLSGALECS
jgi:hypothetical protein